MKSKQDSLDSHLSKMKRENESLWREVLVLRQKHAKQQQIVNKVGTWSGTFSVDRKHNRYWERDFVSGS